MMSAKKPVPQSTSKKAIDGLLDKALGLSKGSFFKLAKAIKARPGTVSLWYRADAQPSWESITKLENFVADHIEDPSIISEDLLEAERFSK